MENKKEFDIFLEPEEDKAAAETAFDQDWPTLPEYEMSEDEWEAILKQHEEEENADIYPCTWDDPNCPSPYPIKDMHEALEDKEDLVECQECFDLFPKAECFKISYGYLCPHCHEIHVIEIPTELVDTNTFDLDFPQPEDEDDDDFEIEDNGNTVGLLNTASDEPVPEVSSQDTFSPAEAPVEITPPVVIPEFDSDDSSDSDNIGLGDKDVEVYLEEAVQLNEIFGLSDAEKLDKAIGQKGYRIYMATDDTEGKHMDTFKEADKLAKLAASKPKVGKVRIFTDDEHKTFIKSYLNGQVKNDLIKDLVSKWEEDSAKEKAEKQEKEKEDRKSAKVDKKIDKYLAKHGSKEEEPSQADTGDDSVPPTSETTSNQQQAPTEAQVQSQEPETKKEPNKLAKAKEGNKKVLKALQDAGMDISKLYIEKTDKNGRKYKAASPELLKLRKELLGEELNEEAAAVDHYELHFRNPEDEKLFGGLDQFKSQDEAYAKSIEYLDDGHPCDIKKLICSGDICSLVGLDEPNTVNEKLEEKAMAPTPFDSEAKVGDKIRIIHLEGEDNSYDGREGEVEHIDGIGQLHGSWGGLAVIPGVDEFEIITEGLTEAKYDVEIDSEMTQRAFGIEANSEDEAADIARDKFADNKADEIDGEEKEVRVNKYDESLKEDFESNKVLEKAKQVISTLKLPEGLNVEYDVIDELEDGDGNPLPDEVEVRFWAAAGDESLWDFLNIFEDKYTPFIEGEALKALEKAFPTFDVEEGWINNDGNSDGTVEGARQSIFISTYLTEGLNEGKTNKPLSNYTIWLGDSTNQTNKVEKNNIKIEDAFKEILEYINKLSQEDKDKVGLDWLETYDDPNMSDWIISVDDPEQQKEENRDRVNSYDNIYDGYAKEIKKALGNSDAKERFIATEFGDGANKEVYYVGYDEDEAINKLCEVWDEYEGGDLEDLDIHPVVAKYIGSNIKAFDNLANKFAANGKVDSWEPGLEYFDIEDWDNWEGVFEYGQFSESLKEGLNEASSAEKKALKDGGDAYADYIQGKGIARIKDPKARDAAIAAIKAGRGELAKEFIGDRKEGQAILAADKKFNKILDKGYGVWEENESLEHTVPQDLTDDRTPAPTPKGELAEPLSGSEMRKHEAGIQEAHTGPKSGWAGIRSPEELKLFKKFIEDKWGSIEKFLDEETSPDVVDDDDYAFYCDQYEQDDSMSAMTELLWDSTAQGDWEKFKEDNLDLFKTLNLGLQEDADVDYVEYMHSYCNALEPHMDELKKITDVEELKKAILDIVNSDPDVNTTKKKNKFTYLIQNKNWSSTANIMKYLEKAMEKAKSIEVKVDDEGELIKEAVEEELVTCGWCGEEFPESECRYEVDFGPLCDGCERELKSRGEKLTFEESLKEAVVSLADQVGNRCLDLWETLRDNGKWNPDAMAEYGIKDPEEYADYVLKNIYSIDEIYNEIKDNVSGDEQEIKKLIKAWLEDSLEYEVESLKEGLTTDLTAWVNQQMEELFNGWIKLALDDWTELDFYGLNPGEEKDYARIRMAELAEDPSPIENIVEWMHDWEGYNEEFKDEDLAAAVREYLKNKGYIKEDIEKELKIQNNENIIEDEKELNPPIATEYFPNNMGINLCSVKSEKWEEQDDGQLKKIEIEFDPATEEELTEAKEEEEEIPTDFAGIMDYLSKDEEEAIEGYDEVLDNVEDEKVKDNLEHIRDEEVAHKEYLDAAKEDPTVDYEHDEAEEEKTESLKEDVSGTKYAIGYCFWDYGWYEELIEKNEDGTTCCTNHRDASFDDWQGNQRVYTGQTFDSVDACITEVNNNIDKYAPYTYPENIDYAAGRRNGSIYAIGLNEEQDGWVSRKIIFDCKAHKLVKAK